jgi:hypothetical protein
MRALPPECSRVKPAMSRPNASLSCSSALGKRRASATVVSYAEAIDLTARHDGDGDADEFEWGTSAASEASEPSSATATTANAPQSAKRVCSAANRSASASAAPSGRFISEVAARLLPDFKIGLAKAKVLRGQRDANRANILEGLNACVGGKNPALAPLADRLLRATAIFAQREAGSACCIDARGLVLTCAHCFADDDGGVHDENDCAFVAAGRARRALGMRCIVLGDGTLAVGACVARDYGRDVALMQIVYVHERSTQDGDDDLEFVHIPIASVRAAVATRVACVGQPATRSRGRGGRCELAVSYGRVERYAADAHDSSVLGAMEHSAWTYWGHSGAPLVRVVRGCAGTPGSDSSEAGLELVGMHSSWDETRGARHGVPVEPIHHVVGRGVKAARFHG